MAAWRRGAGLVLVALAIMAAAGCGGRTGGGASAGGLPLLEYTLVTEVDPSKFASPEHDVVTPYIEKKFNIRIKEVTWYNVQVQPFREMMNQWIAANNLPDVFLTSSMEYSSTEDLGVFADLGPYVKSDMPNHAKYFDARYWNSFKNKGVITQIPCAEVSTSNPRFATDPYVTQRGAHCLWVREDILRAAGYTFEPMADIAKRTTELGKKCTLKDLAVTPAINTPEDFYQMLKKIKALNLKVGDKPVIPLEMYNWYMFHMGTMFDYGQFRIDKDKKVAGYLGAPGAKPWYRFLNRLYQEGLIDQDFSIQKADQMEAKVASGRVACGGYVDNFGSAQESMKKAVPGAAIRYIPWPKETPGMGFADIFKGGFRSVAFNKNFKEIKRLVRYFDWFYSDEGLDLITWGPQEAGLWELKDGKKVFKDKTLERDILAGTKGARGADYYGLFDWTQGDPLFYSKAVNGVPYLAYPNPKSYLRSYPLKLDVAVVASDLCAQPLMNTNGTASYPVGQAASATDTYFWGDFLTQDSAKLLMAKTPAEFDKAWDEVYKIFLEKGQYEQAVKDMEKVLNP
jgi:putative aldouronate transport system substrate-binding protein